MSSYLSPSHENTYPTPSPDHSYTAAYDFMAVNRHPIDLFRLLSFKPKPVVVDRFVAEGVIPREEVDAIRKGFKILGGGMALSTGLCSLTLVIVTRRVSGLAGPVNRAARDVFAGMMGGLAGALPGWHLAGFVAGETIYNETSNGGETALLVYKYMSVVKDPKNGLPPLGSPLFSDLGRPNFAIRRPLEWQKVGSKEVVDQMQTGWKSFVKFLGFGFGK